MQAPQRQPLYMQAPRYAPEAVRGVQLQLPTTQQARVPYEFLNPSTGTVPQAQVSQPDMQAASAPQPTQTAQIPVTGEETEDVLLQRLEEESQNLALQIQILQQTLQGLKTIHHTQQATIRALRTKQQQKSGREKLVDLLSAQEAQPKSQPTGLFASLFPS